MAVVAGDGDQITCPVMLEWLKLDAVVSRAAHGKIALCNSKTMDRSTVTDNYELIAPLVTHYGILIAIKVTPKISTNIIMRPIVVRCKIRNKTNLYPARYATELGIVGRPCGQIPLLLPTSW